MSTSTDLSGRSGELAIDVGVLLVNLAQVLVEHTPQHLVIDGVVSSWRFNRGWGSGELCAYRDGAVAARVAFAVQRAGLPAGGVRRDMVVRVRGRLVTSPPWHAVRLQVDSLVVLASNSSAALRRESLLAVLAADGRLDAQQRFVLPDAADCVGLVTAAGSAAYADIVGTLLVARTPVRVVERFVTLSGVNAAGEIADALASCATANVEVIIVARGGGPSADLEVFDSELVADAIARCPVPVVTAIGHATDATVADRVAHTHVVTPTAAAVLISAGHQRRHQAARDDVAAARLRAAASAAADSRAAYQRAATHRRVLFAAVCAAALIAVVLAALLVAAR